MVREAQRAMERRIGGLNAWALALALAFGAAQGIAQQDEGPILRPHKPAPKPAAVSATLLVTCDLACNWKLDGVAQGRIEAGGSAKAKVELGQHLVVAVTEDGLDKAEQVLDIEAAKQALARIGLASPRDARLKAEQAARDKAAQDKRDKIAQEAREKAQSEAQSQGEQQAREKAEHEASEKAAREQREKQGQPGERTSHAESLLNENRLDEALSEFQELAKADPANAGALVHIGEIQRRQQKFEEALNTIRKARKLDPDSLEVGYNEGLLLDVLGHYDEAVAVFQKMVDLTSRTNGVYSAGEKNNRAIFLERLGAVYREQNKTQQAIAIYQKMVDMGSETEPKGYQDQVEAYREAKQFDKAAEVSRKAVEANPKDRDLKLMLAGELLDQGKTDEGLTVAKGLLDNSSEDRSVLLALGQMYVRVRRWKDAEEALNKAEKLTTKKEDQAYLLFLRGQLAERQKHYDLAEQYFRKVLEMDPSSAMTLNYLGYIMANRGMHLDEALRLIRKAVDLEPMNGAYLDSLGLVYLKLGEYKLAEENLSRAVERDQNDPSVHEHLGDLYLKMDRIRLAAEQWEIALQLSGKSAPADVEPNDLAKLQLKLTVARDTLVKEGDSLGPSKMN